MKYQLKKFKNTKFPPEFLKELIIEFTKIKNSNIYISIIKTNNKIYSFSKENLETFLNEYQLNIYNSKIECVIGSIVHLTFEYDKKDTNITMLYSKRNDYNELIIPFEIYFQKNILNHKKLEQ
ncbi:hypothetical protein FOA24_09330 [Bacillus thuringiensis]|uniref:hypothetical protein n=1 Tax=Bacillus thuringiensis TaxID=1428 RepID=UPI003337E3CA